MLDWNEYPAVERVSGSVSGVWWSRGTRLAMTAHFENPEDGAPVADFRAWFPGVTSAQVAAVFAHPERSLLVAGAGTPT